MTQATPKSYLLNLPPELREAIFTHALLSPKNLVAFHLDSNYQRESHREATQPPLTRVSSQIRSETLPIFYRVNDFLLHTDPGKIHSDHRTSWFNCIQHNLPDLRQISILVRHRNPADYGRSSSGAIRLQLRRAKRNERWHVATGEWRWVTPTRAPEDLAADVEFLHTTLESMLEAGRGYFESAQGYIAALMDLQMVYVKRKIL